jgi:hypothetical protein
MLLPLLPIWFGSLDFAAVVAAVVHIQQSRYLKQMSHHLSLSLKKLLLHLSVPKHHDLNSHVFLLHIFLPIYRYVMCTYVLFLLFFYPMNHTQAH